MNSRKSLGAVLAAIVLFVSFTATAVAGPFEDAQETFNRGSESAAFELLLPLAEHGDVRAQELLGYMYFVGRGVHRDSAEAAKWYLAAANQGSYEAQREIGLLYMDGNGVPQDYIEAYKWCTIALAQQKKPEGLEILNPFWFIQTLNKFSAKMTPAQIAEAQKLAREWKPK
jgi:TPR repeat protein